SGKAGPTIKHEGTDVSALAVDGKGTLLACAGSGKAVELWDLKTRKRAGTLKSDGSFLGVSSLALSADGGTLFRSDAGTVVGWNLAKKKETIRAAVKAYRIAITPDGKLIAAGANQNAKVLDAATGKVKAQIEDVPEGFGATSVAFSPNGKMLAL